MREDTVRPLRSGSTPGMFSFSLLNETEVNETTKLPSEMFRIAIINILIPERNEVE